MGGHPHRDPALTCDVGDRLAKMGEPADRTVNPSSPQVPRGVRAAYGTPAVETVLVRVPDLPHTSVVVSVTE